MSVRISIFSQLNGSAGDGYADYRDLIASLPVTKWTPNNTGSSSKMYQGVAEVSSIDFLIKLLSKVGISAVISYTDDGLVLVLMDGDAEDV